jgi:hypothetical protein
VTYVLLLSGKFILNAIRSRAEVLAAQLDSVTSERDQLKAASAEYLGAPLFDIAVGDVAFSKASFAAQGPLEVGRVLAAIRITNVGERGAALDWAAAVKLADGRIIGVVPLPLDDLQTHGLLAGKIAKHELIQERTAIALERNDTRHGRFLGHLPLEIIDQVPGGVFRVWCRNYQRRMFGCDVPLTAESADPQPSDVPTLDRLVYIGKREAAKSQPNGAADQAD